MHDAFAGAVDLGLHGYDLLEGRRGAPRGLAFVSVGHGALLARAGVRSLWVEGLAVAVVGVGVLVGG